MISGATVSARSPLGRFGVDERTFFASRERMMVRTKNLLNAGVVGDPEADASFRHSVTG
jgi:hypothetical protein